MSSGESRLQALLDEGVATGIFPRARAEVRLRGERVFEGGAGGTSPHTIFDLASLTKVMCTAAVSLSLWAEGAIEPDAPVSRHLSASAAGRAGATIGDLLQHRAGLPAFVPFFAEVMRKCPALFAPDCPAEVRAAARRAAVDQALATPPSEPPRIRAVYSDVGFIVLGELLEAAGTAPLDVLFVERVAEPLALGARFRRVSAVGASGEGNTSGGEQIDIASTGAVRPRAPAPGQEGLWPAVEPRPSPPGEVDDDNAWVLDGVAGHAGLFGTAVDVAAFGQAVLEDAAGAARMAPPRLWARALARDDETRVSTRALGFDTRLPGDAPTGSSAGRCLGQRAPGAVGHTGFTGVSLWIDLARQLVVALCTNRTALGRGDSRIRDFRPRFHDAVAKAVGGDG